MAKLNRVALVVLSAGVAVILGRWPIHWHHHPVLAVISAIVIAGVIAGVLTRKIAALRMVALLCLVDAAMLVHRWSVHLPVHCNCVPKRGAPAILGSGGVTLLADLAMTALAVWLSRQVRARR